MPLELWRRFIVGQVFNQVYDAFMSQKPYIKYATSYLSVIGEREINSILEAGCGSGLFLQAMQKLGLNPVGMDIDNDILVLAAKRYPGTLVQGDICSYKSDIKWEVIYCPLDVLNYLSRKDLKKAMQNIALLLKTGGLLIFDVHSKRRLKTMQGAFSQETSNEGSYFWSSRSRGRWLSYRIDCKYNNNYETYRLKERIHTIKEIKKAGREAKLKLQEISRAWDRQKVDRKTDRLLFVFTRES